MNFMGLHSYSKMHTVNLYSLNSMLLRCCLTLGQVPGVAHCTRLVVLVTKAKYMQKQLPLMTLSYYHVSGNPLRGLCWVQSSLHSRLNLQ